MIAHTFCVPLPCRPHALCYAHVPLDAKIHTSAAPLAQPLLCGRERETNSCVRSSVHRCLNALSFTAHLVLESLIGRSVHCGQAPHGSKLFQWHQAALKVSIGPVLRYGRDMMKGLLLECDGRALGPVSTPRLRYSAQPTETMTDLQSFFISRLLHVIVVWC